MEIKSFIEWFIQSKIMYKLMICSIIFSITYLYVYNKMEKRRIERMLSFIDFEKINKEDTTTEETSSQHN